MRKNIVSRIFIIKFTPSLSYKYPNPTIHVPLTGFFTQELEGEIFSLGGGLFIFFTALYPIIKNTLRKI